MSTLGAPPRTAARGHAGRHSQKRIVIQFDDETFDEISRRAAKENVSFAEIVRRLVEWGLEA